MLKKLTCLFLLLITLLLITAGPFHVSGDFVGIITGGIDGSKDITLHPIRDSSMLLPLRRTK